MTQLTDQLQTLANFTKELKKPLNDLAGLKKQIDNIWDPNGKSSASLNGMWKEMDKRYSSTFCLLLEIVAGYTLKPSPSVKFPMTDAQKLLPELTASEIADIKLKYNTLCKGN